MALSAKHRELLLVVDSVAAEKGIEIERVNLALEAAFQKAARTRYGMETDLKANFNTETGEIKLTRQFQVVDEIENAATEMTLDMAQVKNPDAKVGDTIEEELPPLDFSRNAAQSAKQVIIQMVREAEREMQYEEYKDQIGEIVHGTVKRIEMNGNVFLDISNGEAIIRRDQLIPREIFRNGDRTRAIISDVRREPRGPQIFLSRTSNEFMAKLFASEVPEIYDGVVEIKAVARDPGSRAKIAVITSDSSIDPVGACVGHRGTRVQAVVNELQNEKIDIIPWSPEVANFIVSTLQPAEVTKVVLNENTGKIEVAVPEDNLSQAIGRRGQNVRLASHLTGWDIDILTEAEESERRQLEFTERTELFTESLNVDEMIGQLLASEGFSTVEEVIEADVSEISEFEGFDEEIAADLQERAREHLDEVEETNREECKKLGVSDDLRKIDGMTTAMMVALGKDNVRSLEDFAGCASDDLIGWVERVDGERKRFEGLFSEFHFTREEADQMIMQARVLVGWVDEADLMVEEEQESTEGEEAESMEETKTDSTDQSEAGEGQEEDDSNAGEEEQESTEGEESESSEETETDSTDQSEVGDDQAGDDSNAGEEEEEK